MAQRGRDTTLAEASRLINGDRRDQYGDSTFRKVAAMWSAYLGIEVKPHQVADLMILLKVARNVHAPKADTYADVAGYAGLGAEEAFGHDITFEA
jgi:hypothetical protein